MYEVDGKDHKVSWVTEALCGGRVGGRDWAEHWRLLDSVPCHQRIEASLRVNSPHRQRPAGSCLAYYLACGWCIVNTWALVPALGTVFILSLRTFLLMG